jgi:ferredoxin
MELSLAVFFRSSSAYDVLRSSGFQLPHPSSLRRQFSTVLSGVGFCPQLREMLRLRTLALAGHERRVTLSLDGMAVTKSLTYKHNKDQLVGMVDCGVYHRSQEIADQGVVVMVRGLTLKWKQVFGYFVTRHNMATYVLQSVIADAVKLLKAVGLYVDAIVMDQESSQWKWMKDMGVSVDRPFVYHHDVQSFVVPDPPHLIKSLRNNLLTKDISFVLEGKEMTATWQHIEQVHVIDSQHKLHLAPKLKDGHFVLQRGKKMKVILACQIFSHSVAVAIKLLVERSLMPAEALDTAAFVEKVNSMWDFIDSHSLTAPPGKKAVTRNDFDADQARFRDFAEFVKTWKFSKRRSIPSHQGWLLALSGLEQLSHKLLVEEKIMTHLCLRKCNQDHVENLHSQIRHYNGFNDHPSVPAYVNALRCLSCSSSVSELLDKTISSGSNCLPDGEHGERTPDPPAPSVAPNESQTECHFASFFPSDDAQHSTSSSVPELQSVEKDLVEYIAGSVVKSCMTKIGCSQCVGKITASASAPSSATPPTLTTLKEFKPGALTHVSQELRKVMELFESHYRIMTTGGLPLSSPQGTILSKFKMVQPDSSFPACECRDTILAAYCKLRIFWDVRLFNQTLKAQKRGSELNKDKKLNM